MPPPGNWANIGQDTDTGQYWGQYNGQWMKLTEQQAKSVTALPAMQQQTNFEAQRQGSPFQIADRNLGLGFERGLGFTPPNPNDPNSLGWMDIAKQTIGNLKQALAKSYQFGAAGDSPGVAKIDPATYLLATGDLGAHIVEGLASGVETGASDAYKGLRTKDPVLGMQGLGEGIAAGGQTAAAMESPDAARAAASAVTDRAGGTLRELTGRGPSMDRLEAGIDQQGLRAKGVLTEWEKAARTDAQVPLNSAVNVMDAHNPGGIVGRDIVSKNVNDIMGELNQIPEGVPEPIRILAKPTTSDLSNASVFGRSTGEALEGVLKTRYRPNLSEATRQRIDEFLDKANIKPAADEDAGGNWTAEQLQQLRSRVGDYVRGARGKSIPGPIKTGMSRVYDYLSTVLDETAEKSGAAPSWELGNAKWASYKHAWDGTWDRGKFNASPLADALEGDTGDDILGPLTGKSAQLARDYMAQYRHLTRKLPELFDSVQKYKRLNTIRSMSHPQGYVYAMPLAAAFRGPIGYGMGAYGAARILTPAIWRWIATHGINPENVRNLPPIQPGGAP